MENQIVKKLLNSKCKKDAKGSHYFEKIGIIEEGGDVNLIWRCSQCKECLIEPLIFLEVSEDDFRMSEEQESARRIIGYFFKSIKDHTKISRKKFYSILHQVYYIAQEETKKGGHFSSQN